MSNKKVSILSRILEEEKLYKMAQEVGAGETEIDPSAADQMAQQIFDQLFDEELKKLIGQS